MGTDRDEVTGMHIICSCTKLALLCLSISKSKLLSGAYLGVRNNLDGNLDVEDTMDT